MAEGTVKAEGEVQRILIADDHPLFRKALIVAVRRVNRELPVSEYATFGCLEAALADDHSSSVVLLDLKLPDSAGFSGLLKLREHFPELRVAVVSATEDWSTIQQAMICGAAGYVPKSIPLANLVSALTAIVKGERWIPAQHVPEMAVMTDALEPLSPAQFRVYSALQRGLMNKQIAYELGVTEATVKAHLTALFRKLGVQSRTQALAVRESASLAQPLVR